MSANWRVEVNDSATGPGMLLISVIYCQEAWRRLTNRQRRELLAAEETGRIDQDRSVHRATLAALVRHGLVDESGALTRAAKEVLRFRPKEHP